jgi:hypothetical protein
VILTKFAVMKRIFHIVLGLFLSVPFLSAQTNALNGIRVAKLQYEGGGDWYSNPTSVPNLIEYIRENTNIQLDPEEYIVKPGGTQIFQYPYVYMTGHGRFLLSDEEAKNLRTYLMAGGFLHIDDNYGMDKYVRVEMKKVFPELEFVELPFNHEIYKSQYEFNNGLPKIHEHDNKPPKGLALILEGRVVCFYTLECDLGDGWEDQRVHNDPETVRQQALRMGTNIVIYALNN